MHNQFKIILLSNIGMKIKVCQFIIFSEADKLRTAHMCHLPFTKVNKVTFIIRPIICKNQ